MLVLFLLLGFFNATGAGVLLLLFVACELDCPGDKYPDKVRTFFIISLGIGIVFSLSMFFSAIIISALICGHTTQEVCDHTKEYGLIFPYLLKG